MYLLNLFHVLPYKMVVREKEAIHKLASNELTTTLTYSNLYCSICYSSTIVNHLIIVIDFDWSSAWIICLDHPIAVVYIR